MHQVLMTNVIVTTLILAVWGSPIEPVFYSKIVHPVYWIQPVPVPDLRMYPTYQPNYFPGWYTFPYFFQPEHRPPIRPHYTRENLEDSQALERLVQLKEANPERVIVSSSIGKPSNSISFSDKSLLGFFDNLSLRFVSRISSLPNIRLSYKNITLTGLAIG